MTVGDPMDVLATAFDSRRTELQQLELRRAMGKSWDAAIKAGLIGPALHHKHMACNFCSVPGHLAPITYCDTRSVYLLDCLEAGKIPVRPAAAEPVAFNEDAFAREVARAFDVREFKGYWHEKENSLFLGEGQSGETLFSVFLLRGLSDENVLRNILSRDEEGAGKSRGIYLCRSIPPLPKDQKTYHRFASFLSLLAFSAEGLKIRPRSLRRALSLNSTLGARMDQKDIVFKLIEQFEIQQGRLPSSRELSEYGESNGPVGWAPLGKTQMNEYLGAYRAKQLD